MTGPLWLLLIAVGLGFLAILIWAFDEDEAARYEQLRHEAGPWTYDPDRT